MTTALLPPTSAKGPSAQVRRVADTLLADQATAGAHVAELVESLDTDIWARALPWVALLARETRALVGGLAELRGVSVPSATAFETPEAVPPVVWAREIGLTQRLVLAAIRDIEQEAPALESLALLAGAARRIRSALSTLASISAA